MRNNKGQAATEFLMTYGWAILVVIVAVAALAYFGVMSPDKYLPEKCLIEPGYSCVDYKVSTNETDFVFKNAAGFSIEITSIKIGDCELTGLNRDITDGEQYQFKLIGCNNGDEGSQFKRDIEIVYKKNVANISKKMSGELITKIQ